MTRGRTGPRVGDSGTREAILQAARQRFADHGYVGATIRGIAADAGVGPALVHHFYGPKEQLFAAAMRLPVVPTDVLARAAGPDPGRSMENLGENLVRTALRMWDVAEVRTSFLGLLRSALTDDRALRMLKEFLTETILTAIAGSIGSAAGQPAPGQPAADLAPDDANYRASLVASQMVGLGLVRYLLELEPLADAQPDDLAVAIGPTLQRYLTGDVRSADGDSRKRPEPPSGE